MAKQRVQAKIAGVNPAPYTHGSKSGYRSNTGVSYALPHIQEVKKSGVKRHMFLRPKEIAIKLGTSTTFVSRLIRRAKPAEQKREDGKTLFSFDDCVAFIRKQAK